MALPQVRLIITICAAEMLIHMIINNSSEYLNGLIIGHGVYTLRSDLNTVAT